MENKNVKKGKGLNQIKSGTNIVFNIIFIILSLMCIVPVIFVFIISISSEASLAEYGYRFVPAELSDAAYLYLWKERMMILKALWISVIVTMGGTILGLGLTTSMGYVLSRQSYKLQNFFTWVIFIPMIFNGGLAASYVVNDKLLNLSDTLLALILPLAVSSFNIIICKTFFRTTIPDSVIESAKIDGATQLGIEHTVPCKQSGRWCKHSAVSGNHAKRISKNGDCHSYSSSYSLRLSILPEIFCYRTYDRCG